MRYMRVLLGVGLLVALGLLVGQHALQAAAPPVAPPVVPRMVPATTATPPPTFTPTITSTPTVCGVTINGNTPSCHSDTYNSYFGFYNNCSVSLSGTSTIVMQVSTTYNGPWTDYDQNTGSQTFMPGSSGYGYGFTEPNLPAQYIAFRFVYSSMVSNGQQLNTISTVVATCNQGSVTPTPTGYTSRCFVNSTGAQTTCTLPSTYSYDFGLYIACGTSIPGNGTIQFQVSSAPSGPWTTYDQQTFGQTFPPGAYSIQGNFNEPNIPLPNTWYRVTFSAMFAGGHNAANQTDPTPLCGTPAATVTPTLTPTISATPTATVCTSTQTLSSSIDGSEPTKHSVNPIGGSSCANTGCLGERTGNFHYDVYTFTNPNPSSVCITVILNNSGCGSSGGFYSAAYQAGFDPNNACTNYLDGGVRSPGQYTFVAPPGPFLVVVEEFTANAGCANYSLTLNGLPCPATPTPPPIPSASPTTTRSAATTPSATSTASASPTNTRSASTTPSPTACTIQYTDVDGTNPYYTYIRCLACRGIVSGYATSPPCAIAPCFLWGNPVTRGQAAKMVSNAAGYADPIASTQQTFADVAYGSPFWLYVERAVLHGVISGYSTSPPCPAGQVPCFLPGSIVTRGQLAKIDAQAASYSEAIPSTRQTFGDVPYGSPFWLYVERVYLHAVINGYLGSGTSINPCTGVVEGAGQLYFRPCSNSTRGQASKVVANTFYPNCQTPGPPPPSATPTPGTPNLVGIAIYDNYYSPANASGPLGDTFSWTNYGTHTHTVTSDNGDFDSGPIPPGGTYYAFVCCTVTSYPYHSTLDVGMTGVITLLDPARNKR